VALLALASALPGLAAFTSSGSDGGDSAASERGLTRHDMLVGTGIMLIVATTSGASSTRRFCPVLARALRSARTREV
jgi:hypothetical protein